MKLDGQLEKAQFENIADSAPSSVPLGRVYCDTSDAANAVPRFYDGTAWFAFLTRKCRYTSVTTTAVLAADTEYLRCDSTAAAFAVTLPTAASMSGKMVRIHKTDLTFNAVTITGNGGDQIDGASTSLLTSRGEWVLLLSLGTSWTVIAWDHYKGKTAFTPTGAWSTNTTYTGYWWRTGNRINLEVHIALAGAPTSATLTINMPTGTSIDTTQMLNTTAGKFQFGYINIFDTSASADYIGSIYYGSSSILTCKKDSGDGTVAALTQAAPVTFATGDALDITAMGIPVTNWRG